MRKNVTRNRMSDADMKRIKRVVKRANAGDESVVPELRNLLKRLPEIAGPMGGNLARQAEKSLVSAVAGSKIVVREAIFQQLERLRRELGEPAQGALERLLVERVVLCWLYVSYADYQYALADDTTLQFSEFLQRQQDRAQRRYLAAIRCLATIRRLALPIKLDVTVAGSVETNHAGPACRRTVDVRHSNRPQRQ